MKNKIIKNTFNTTHFILILVVINIAIQTSLQKTYIKKENNSLKAKNLNTISFKPKLADGAQCDTNSYCKSGYCGYNGPYLSRSPKDYSQYVCM